MRSGSAEIRAPANSGGPTLALASMGQLSIGGKTFSVWRIRNNSAKERRVTLLSRSSLSSAPLDVSAHSDLFVRSESPDARHALLSGFTAVDEKSAARGVWHDSRTIDDPLCAEPGTTLWVRNGRGVLRVSPIDGRTLLDLPVPEAEIAASAIDPVDGSIWVYGASRLQAFSLRGKKLSDLRLSLEPQLEMHPSARLSIDTSHRVWLVLGRRLFQLSALGSVLGTTTLSAQVTQLEFDSATNTMWASSESGLLAWAGDVLAASNPDNPLHIQIAGSSCIAVVAGVERPASQIWAAAGSVLRRFDSGGAKLLEVRLPAAGTYDHCASDAHHGLWLAGAHRLTHFSAQGTKDFDATPLDWSSARVAAVSADLHADTVWAVTPDHLWEYSQQGGRVPLLGRLPADVLLPQPGLLLPASRRLINVSVFNDFTAPELRVSAPADGATLSSTRPLLQFNAVEHEGRLDLGSLSFSINGASTVLNCIENQQTHLNCSLAQDLPQGRAELSASIADDGGNRSATQRRQVTIDSVPPRIPAPELIRAASSGGTSVQVTGSPGAVEGGTSVLIKNLASGALVRAGASADGSFLVSISALASEVLQLQSEDSAGNLSPPVAVSFLAEPPVLLVTTPTDGAVVTDRDLIVRGSLTGPLSAGIMVGGVAVNLVGAGNVRTFEARVPLSPGANMIDTVAHLPDGSQLVSHRTVTLANPPNFGVRVSASVGVPPFEVTFSINQYENRRARSVTYDFNGDSAVDVASDDPQIQQSFTSRSPGEFDSQVVITADDGAQYRFSIPVVALSNAELDQQIRATWHQFLNGLAMQSLDRAASSLTADIAGRLTPALQNLLPGLASIASSFSEPRPNMVSANLAEYVVTREVAGDVKAFLIYFALDTDGVWRIAGL